MAVSIMGVSFFHDVYPLAFGSFELAFQYLCNISYVYIYIYIYIYAFQNLYKIYNIVCV